MLEPNQASQENVYLTFLIKLLLMKT